MGSNSAPTTLLKAKWVRRYVYGIPTAVCIEIANPADADANISYAYSQFSAVDGGRFVYPPRLHTPGHSIQIDTPLLYGDLNPGQKRRGQLLFDVPVGSGLTKLVWDMGIEGVPSVTVDLPASRGPYVRDAC